MSSLPYLLIFSLASPLLLWPIEQIFPWPHIIEEIAKSTIAIFLANRKQTTRHPLIWPVICGFLFAFSETMFYLLNFMKLGHFSHLFTRIILTSSLHITTLLLVYLAAKKSQLLLFLAFLVSVLIHYGFNVLVASYGI